jgi:bifunctional non-homologous end joining protein LigD
MQEKFDGRRGFLKKHGPDIIATNRLGLSIGLMDTVLQAAAALPHDFIIDGELVDETLVAFDLVHVDDQPLTGIRYAVRLEHLRRLCGHLTSGILVAPTARTTHEKTTLYEQLKRDRKEGVVFKRHDAPYTPGRPNSGGSQWKVKFYTTCSAIATAGRNGKRSIGLGLLDVDRMLAVGNVTVPTNHAVPQPGDIVEVRYLYAYPGGSLYQPVLLGVRDDIEREACQVSQLKFKAPTEHDDDGS